MRETRGGTRRPLRPARRKLQLLAELHARFHQEVRDMFLRPLSFSLALLLTTAPVFAQTAPTPPAVTPTTTPRETIEGTLSQERTVIGIPPLATASVQTVAGLRTDSLGRQIAEVIAADLERSGLYEPIGPNGVRSEEHTSELQSLMRISYAVFCLKKKKQQEKKYTKDIRNQQRKKNI